MTTRIGFTALLCALTPTLASGATFDASLADRPCDIVTAQMVAATFDVPAGDLRQTDSIASRCYYKMNGEGRNLNVEFSVRAYDSDEAAAKYFRNYTRSMSPDEIAEGMEAIKEKAIESGEPGANGQNKAIEGIGAALQQIGIQFEDVSGIADQARFETSDGTLHLQLGNLLMKLRAFHGPGMTAPDKITQKTMMKALITWQQGTMDARRKQAAELAKTALEAI